MSWRGKDYTFWGQRNQSPQIWQTTPNDSLRAFKTLCQWLIKYFSSDNFKGIGKKTAERIVEIYGEDPIDKILEDPSKLEQIP